MVANNCLLIACIGDGSKTCLLIACIGDGSKYIFIDSLHWGW